MWQANLPLRERGVGGPRPELVPHAGDQGKDADQDHPCPGSGPHAPAAGVWQNVSGPVAATPGSKRADLRREIGETRRGEFPRYPKKGVQEAFDEEVRAEIEALIGSAAVEHLDFEAMETAVRRRSLLIAARAIEQRLNADTSDYVGPSRPCSCEQQARYAGRRVKTVETVLGPLTLSRASYYCSACQRGCCPRDHALGIETTSLSPGVTRMVGRVAAMVSFAESSTLLAELAGVPVNPKQVERTAEALGCEIAADERQAIEASPPAGPTMYLGLDGTGVPLRPSELVNRTGKQPDGTSKTREVKLVTAWTAEARDDDGHPIRDRGSVTYSAAIESAATADTDTEVAPFIHRVVREATRRGFHGARRRVILGDGALWIWNLADEHFPGALQILDLYHAKGHLWDVAKAIYGPGTDLAEQWAKLRRDQLDEGKIDAILALHAHANEEARKCFDYVTRHRHRMQYPEFRAQGLCVGSGVVEAGCKTAIGTRCKRAGMHWTVAGADAIIARRCCKLSGCFEDFWERRSAAACAGP